MTETDRMSTAANPTPAKKPPKDSPRELVETIVFVVVLVLILKLFVVEAFVIPTGSMAETLFGYHKTVQCDQCGYTFPVNASEEEEGRKDNEGNVRRYPVIGYHCPNCDHEGRLKPNDAASGDGKVVKSDEGDRVLVHKAMRIDHRGSVVVFKFPKDPQLDHVAQNYIKRLVGFGGETIAIYHGDLFVHKSLAYPTDSQLHPLPEDPKDLWDKRYTYTCADTALKAFDSSKALGFPEDGTGFELIRKPDDQVLAMRRIVYHNDFQAKDLTKIPPRWKTSGEGWGAAEAGQKIYTHTGDGRGFLKYEHLRVKNSQRMRDFTEATKPQRITNFMGYNAGSKGTGGPDGMANEDANDNWVGDLHVECNATIADPASSVILDLARGPNRYQVHFADGQVKLIRTGPGGKELSTRPTPMTKAGTYALRFANVDCRLRVWVDGEAIDFGGQSDYPYEMSEKPDKDDSTGEGWSKVNDIDEPAAIEVRGGVTLANIVLWRDTFYTHTPGHKTLQPETFFVQPGHFLCFGDNSSQSHDGRGWGLVPERLMLGRAVFTFWPFRRIGFIR